jgi:pimeloyl-ACP methyl ester carboxylesterase
VFSNFDVSIKFKTLTVDGKKVQTYSIGEGDSVVISYPPFPHSGLIYSLFMLHQEKPNIKFITFDLPGWVGMTEPESHGDFHLDDISRITKAIIHEYKIKEFGLLGYSFGGILATRTAHRYKNRVTKVALVSTVINGTLTSSTKDYKKIEFVEKLGLANISKYYLQSRFNKYKKSLIDDGVPIPFIEWYASMMNNIDPKALFESINLLFKGDFTRDFQKLPNVPLLIVNSKTETRYFRQQAEYLRRLIKGESSLYLTGEHEDFLLHPKKKVVTQVINFFS